MVALGLLGLWFAWPMAARQARGGITGAAIGAGRR
jgi:hypothetical protein